MPPRHKRSITHAPGTCAVHVRVYRTPEGCDRPVVVARRARAERDRCSVRTLAPTTGPKGSCSSSGRGRCSVGSRCRASGAPCASPIRPRCRSTTSSIGSTRSMSTRSYFAPSLSHAIVRVADGRPRLPSVSLVRSQLRSALTGRSSRRCVGSSEPHLTIRAGYAASEVGPIAHLDIGPDDPIGDGRIPLGRLGPGRGGAAGAAR